MGYRVAAIDRTATIDEAALLKDRGQKIRIDRRARDMGFGLPLKPQGQWCRIVTETKIWRDAQIENDRGSRLGPSGRGGGWPDEIAPAIEQHEGAGREAVERDVLQCCGPIAPIGGGERDSGRRRCVGR